jgi:cysteinyl-tRNA synthetase
MPLELNLYNTLSRRLEPLQPREPGKIGLYTCGPTVYHFAHLGNLRTYVFEDLLTRALRLSGYAVTHVCNITDVGHLTDDGDSGDDKMEKGAEREGKSVWDIARFYTDAFLLDLQRLRVQPATVWPKATDHIAEQIAMVQGLVDKGFAYATADCVYYDVSKFPRYADFARKDLKGQEAGARIAPSDGKRNHEDFALWKLTPPGQKRLMEWDSPWGRGFPGWHIECSAMSLKYLGPQFDIHCGGIDHIPVHHTNEIAQTEAFTGLTPWVNLWMHGEFLILDKGKMSKSSGDFLTLQAIVDKGYDPLDYRFFCLGTHYRAPLNFSFEALDGAKSARASLRGKTQAFAAEALAPEALALAHPLWLKFWAQVSDDLNSPRALAVVWDVIKDASLEAPLRAALLAKMDAWLGLDLLAPESAEAPLSAAQQKLLDERAAARAAKDFAASDRLRDALAGEGILVKDGKGGQTWHRTGR